MHSSKKSFVAALLLLYFVSGFGTYWNKKELEEQITNLKDDVMLVNLKMNTLEREIRDLEDEVDELNNRCDNLDNYISSLSLRISDLEVVDDEEQIEDETKEGEIEMLAQLIEAEAGNQDFIGKCLVADVVLNRVESSIFPNTVEEVIFEKHFRKKDSVWCYQFSTVKYGTFEKAGWNISAESLAAARQEYESERLDDKLLYFTAGSYNDYCIPAYKYGDHYFGY